MSRHVNQAPLQELRQDGSRAESRQSAPGSQLSNGQHLKGQIPASRAKGGSYERILRQQQLDRHQQSDQSQDRAVVAALQGIQVAANSAMVSRTQRVVRQRALAMQAQKRRSRDLWLACSICSAWLIMMAHSAWTGFMQNGFMQYESGAVGSLRPIDMIESSAQMLVMAMWFLPVSAAVLMLVWFKRSRDRGDNERLEQKSYRSMSRVQIAR